MLRDSHGFVLAACLVATVLTPSSGWTQVQAQKRPAVTPRMAIPALIAESPQAGRTLAEDSSLIIGQKMVQDQLGVDANFKTSYTKIYADLDTAQQDLAKNNGSDTQFDKLRLDADRAVLALLTPSQAERLKQLALQAFGLEGFGIPDVQQSLAFSAEQRGLIDQVLKAWSADLDAYGEKVAAVSAANPQSDSDNPKTARASSDTSSKAFRGLKPAREKLTAQKAELTKQLMGYLDIKQKGEYSRMLGAPVKVVEPAY